jgi:hypothetical protein
VQKKRTIKLRGTKVSRLPRKRARELFLGHASEEAAKTRAKGLLEVKLARSDILRGKRWYESDLGWARACGLDWRDMTKDTLTASMQTFD